MRIVLSLLLGVLGWTLLEYLLHRFLGHEHKKNPFGAEHTRHHAEGGYFAPSWKKALVTLGFVALLSPPAWWLAGAAGAAFVGGLIGFYALYELQHRLEHVWAGVGPYARWARAHHFHHHFVDPKTNHGVTTPLWDLVFGTYRRPALIRVPRRLCMTWLVDPETGDVRAEHATRFALR